jgi:hypothetical protein
MKYDIENYEIAILLQTCRFLHAQHRAWWDAYYAKGELDSAGVDNKPNHYLQFLRLKRVIRPIMRERRRARLIRQRQTP